MSKPGTTIVTLVLIGFACTITGIAKYANHRSSYAHADTKMEQAKQRLLAFSQDESITTSDIEAVNLDATRWANEARLYRQAMSRACYLIFPGGLLTVISAVVGLRRRRTIGDAYLSNDDQGGLRAVIEAN